MPAAGGSVSVQVDTDSGGCSWTATTASVADVLLNTVGSLLPGSLSLSGSGPGTFVATVTTANPGASSRLLDVTVNGIQFWINQLGTACTVELASPPPFVPAAGGGPFSLQIATQGGTPIKPCGVQATAGPSDTFIHFANGGLATADSATGVATLTFTVDPNPGNVTRRVTFSPFGDPSQSFISDATGSNFLSFGSWSYYLAYSHYLVISQAGQPAASVTPWEVGDVFAGIGSSVSDGGRYRVMKPPVGTAAPAYDANTDLQDAFGSVTNGCMIDPTVANGDLWATSYKGLMLSRFSDATHQLSATLPIMKVGRETVQRKFGTVPVPFTTNNVLGSGAEGWPDINYSESLVFDKNGNIFVGTSADFLPEAGLGYGYLLKFAKNDDGAIAGCPAASPCLVDWWRVDTGGEQPAGNNAHGVNVLWTKTYKSAFTAAYSSAKTATPPADEASAVAAGAQAAMSAVADLAADVSYYPHLTSDTTGQNGTAGIDELDLSSDGVIFYTSEDGYIRKFDTLADSGNGEQKDPLLVSSADDAKQHVGGIAFGLRLLPNGDGKTANGGGGLIVAMSQGVYRLQGNGQEVKPGGAYAVAYDVTGGFTPAGGSHPFAISLTPDAQSFWVATGQNWSDGTTAYPSGGKIYRFHIATGAKSGPYSLGTLDIQALCVKREYLAAVNVCYQTDKDGKAVTVNGSLVPIACQTPPVCTGLGTDEHGINIQCYPPGTAPLVIANRLSYEGDSSGTGGVGDLDLTQLIPDRNITFLSPLPPGLSVVVNPTTHFITAVTGHVSYSTCDDKADRTHLLEQASPPCASFTVRVTSADGASTNFTWGVLHRNAPPTIAGSNATVTALRGLTIPTPVSDFDGEDVLVVSAKATVNVNGSPVDVNIGDYGMAFNNPIAGTLDQAALLPSAGSTLQIVGNPVGYPTGSPNYPTTFNVTLTVRDCSVGKPSPADCFHTETTTFTVTVVNMLPTFQTAAIDQYSDKGVSLASSGSEYTLVANDADTHLPLKFTFSCPAGPGCDSSTGLPYGLSYRYADGMTTPTSTDPAAQKVTIYGTPTTPVNHLPITVTLTDLAGGRNLDAFTFTWTVYDNPTLTVADQTSLKGSPITPYTPSAATVPAGPPLTLSYSASNLPNGLAINATTGTITGTPTTAVDNQVVSLTVTQTVTTGITTSTTQTFKWTINEPPTVKVNNAFSQVNAPAPASFCASPPCGASSGGHAVTYAISALPPGVTLNPGNGLFSGSPTAIGVYTLTVTVTDSVNHLSSPATPFVWTVYGAPMLTLSDQTTVLGTGPVSYTPQAAIVPPGSGLTFSIAGLPAGLTYSSTTGTITGTPTTPINKATVTVTVTQTVTSGITSSTTGTFKWYVYGLGTIGVGAQTTVINAPASYQPLLTGVPTQQVPVTWNITGLPAGLTFNSSTGLIAGSPTAGGLFTVDVKVTDAWGNVMHTSFSWTVITNRAPACSAAAPSTSTIWSPNHKFVNITINGVTDQDGDNVTITINSIWQDEAIALHGSGNTSSDGAGIGTSTAQVRAERTGLQNGRIYQINFTASDGKPGGSCTGSVYVGVPHDQGRQSTPVDSGHRWNSVTGVHIY